MLPMMLTALPLMLVGLAWWVYRGERDDLIRWRRIVFVVGRGECCERRIDAELHLSGLSSLARYGFG
jgi:hypothetical protein